MDKYDFLRLALLNNKYVKRRWMVSVLSIIETDKPEAPKPYDVYCFDGEYVYYDKGEYHSFKPKQYNKRPLFLLDERTGIFDKRWKNVSELKDVSVGLIFSNYISLMYPFNGKLPFLLKRHDGGTISDIIAPILVDNGKGTPETIEVYEMHKFKKAVNFLEDLSLVTTVVDTPTNLVVADDFKDFRARKIEEYGDELKNPVKFNEYEKELAAFDEQHLAKDPTNNKFLTGKVKKVSRKKLLHGLGTPESFGEFSEPILTSLEEGWPTSDEQFPAILNVVRYGSYSRGYRTMYAGVVTKDMLKVSTPYKIVDEDCGTEQGLYQYIGKEIRSTFVGCEVRKQGKWVLIETEDDLAGLIDTWQTFRSPGFCLTKDSAFCKHCLGKTVSAKVDGISLAALDLGSVFLYALMAVFHGTVSRNVTISIDRVFS